MNLQTNKKILKNLQLKNGGILATPKNGAYPYVYTRDAVMITKAFNKLGLTKESEKFYFFMEKNAKLNQYKEVFQRYTKNGFPSVTRSQENDNEGLLIHGIFDTFKKTKKETFLEAMWPLVKQTAGLIMNYSKSGLLKTKRSIHEFAPLESGYEIWANTTAIRGLLDASEIAKRIDDKKLETRYKKRADKILKNLKNKLFDKKRGIYIKNTKFPKVPDMSILAPFYFEIDSNKKSLSKSISFLRENLFNPEIGGFRRFKKFEIVKDWHWYTGGSGSWIVLTLWAAKFYKKLGQTKKYRECMNWVNNISKKSHNLLPEHIATKQEYDEWKRNEIEFNSRIINETKKSEKTIKNFDDKKVVYWATPLGWSHAEYILTLK